jgi:predicted GNAT family acetyltransferase
LASDHPLDRPIWSALSTRQAAQALGDERARRFAPRYGPLAAAADASAENRAGLAELECDSSGLVLLEAESVEAPPGLVVTLSDICVQMVATDVPVVPHTFEVQALGDADAPEMLALARLTRPGPFSTATHRLGSFIGVRQAGVLAAMAGERMRPEGFTEVSGVCAHPDHRGHGYAAALSSLVARRILARGETPFLHAFESNTGAIRLYEQLGFSLRRTMKLTALNTA